MIPAAFDYLRVDDVDAAVAALTEHGDEAKLLAGGHSLLPMMKLRLAFPEVLVDIGRVTELRGVRDEGDVLAIGAATPHAAVIDDPLIRAHCGVLADVAATIADPQVRHRGTFGGALAHGDAAGDLPATVRALDGVFVVRGPGGERQIAAADFFVDYLETALAADEVLVEVRVPKLDSSWRWAYEKFARTAQSWAIVGSCVLVRAEGETVTDARVGLTNVAAVPVRPAAAEAALTAGIGLEDVDLLAGVAVAVDTNADADYRSQLARVLTARARDRALAVRA